MAPQASSFPLRHLTVALACAGLALALAGCASALPQAAAAHQAQAQPGYSAQAAQATQPALAQYSLVHAAHLPHLAWALKGQASFFYVPADMAAKPPEPGRAVRLGGMVQAGSIKTAADGVTVDFMVTGNTDAAIPVRYSGILPDLFVENSGVVAEGSLGPDGVFIATNLLAKHDENYVPKELEGMGTKEAAKMAADTTVGLD